MRFVKETLKLTAILGSVAMIAIAGAPAKADVDCSREDVRIDGQDFGGNPFSVPARLGNPGHPNIGLSEGDCVTDGDQLKRDARRSAGVAAAMDAYAAQPGLNLTLNYANIGLEDDVNAVGAVTTYKHHFADPGVLHSITGKVGFGSDTTLDELGVSAGVSFNFGTF